MRRLAAIMSSLLLLPVPALSQHHRGLNLQTTAPRSPLPPLRPKPSGDTPGLQGPSYDVAPTPNRDLDAPSGPRASAAPELAPGIFTRGQQYRGEGYSAGSSAQSEQDRRARPGAGFKLRLPLQQQ